MAAAVGWRWSGRRIGSATRRKWDAIIFTLVGWADSVSIAAGASNNDKICSSAQGCVNIVLQTPVFPRLLTCLMILLLFIMMDEALLTD